MREQEALQYLVQLGEESEPIIELDQGTYSRVDLNRVKQPKAQGLSISTLTGFVDYIKSNIDAIDTKLLIHVASHKRVDLYGPLNADRERECYLVAGAELPTNIRYEQFLDTEQFNIMLQSSFADKGDKEVLLKYTGLVRDEAVKTTGDDGISQKVTVKTGVASVAEAVVPNPVSLAPYRTFPEIEQPLSKFIFRMKDGPRAAIFEADGGAWRNTAILRIKEYLKEALKENENIEIIA
ncbi:hypothetical protein HYH39_06265 [Clostridium botulinum]|nr:hypothetical protein KU40_05090 [Clostridium botulinum]MBY6778547.1 hypothetical protein [Clostridium botulinum]MBY6851726.1 hypothetical protein [Clostridium botulinum]